MAFTSSQERRIGFWFDVAVICKGLLSLGEIASGLFILFVPFSSLSAFALRIFHEELLEDPGDFIATHVIRAVSGVSPHALAFLAFYLLSRGIVKIGLVAALFKRYSRAYPTAIAFIGISMIYQLYLVVTTGSLVQAALTFFDIFVIWSIWLEWRVVRLHPHVRLD